MVVTYEYFYIKYLLCHSKEYTKHFQFPWENPWGKFFSLFFLIVLVKFRDLKKGIPKKLQRDPMVELLNVLSTDKEKHLGT